MKPIRGLFSSLVLLGMALTVMGDEVHEARTFLLERGIQKIAFVKRYTYTATNFYTEHVNSLFQPGGNICILDLETGTVQELCPELSSGVFERMDVDFDADKIVFAWKAAPDEGYRLYEVHADGTSLRQVLPPPGNESRLVRRYRSIFHHGTDDMSPCYLPDGGICFVSTRCQHGITCDSPDILTTSALYRCDIDGRNVQRLTNSPVSEMSPSILSDGRILYTRWEYVDKGSGRC